MFSDEGDIRYTYRETVRLAKNVAHHLRKMGVKKGDHIAIWSRLEPKWVIAFLGIIYSGGVAVPLDVEYGEEEIISVLNETGCGFIFTAREKLQLLQKIVLERTQALALVAMDSANTCDGVTGVEELFQDSKDNPPLSSISPEDAAIIFYTSGTTGKPKGVVIQHRSITNSTLGLLQYIQLSAEDRVLAIIPAHHIFAALANIFIPLARGASVTYASTVKSTELLKTIQRAKITTFPGVPQIFYLLHQKIFDEIQRKPLPVRLVLRILLRTCFWLRRGTGFNPGRLVFAKVHQTFGGHLRLLISTASFFDPKIIRDFYSLGFTVYQGYGMTETFGGGTLTPFYHNVIGSVGIPISGVKLTLIEPDETGVGEIAISGLSVMHGYFKDQESSAGVLKDGWFYTGDLGYRDAQGNYYITGRRKEMIVLSSGKNIYPEEVENHYLQSLYINEMCVLGVTDSSNYARSERLHAIIVPNFDYLKRERIVNSQTVIRIEIEKLSLKLPKYKRIMTYEVQAEPLPRTRTRKIMRWVVQQRRADSALNMSTLPESRYTFVEGDDLLLNTGKSTIVLDVIRKESQIKRDLHLDMNLELDLGFDSLRRIELIANIEQLLNIRLGDDSVSQFLTIRDLLNAVNQNQGESVTLTADPSHSARITWKEILSAPGGDRFAEKYVLKTSSLASWVYFILLKLIFIFAKVLFKLEVQGLENIPRQTPFLICPNHQSYLDGILVPSVLPYSTVKHLFTVGYSPYFSGRLKDMVARLTRIVPIDPDTNLVRAMKVSAICLKSKKVLLIFPEGDRTYDGELQPFKKGAAILARELRVPVLPIAIDGSFNAWSKVSERIRFVQIKITIGKPLYFSASEVTSFNHEEDYNHISHKMHDEIKNLLHHTPIAVCK